MSCGAFKLIFLSWLVHVVIQESLTLTKPWRSKSVSHWYLVTLEYLLSLNYCVPLSNSLCMLLKKCSVSVCKKEIRNSYNAEVRNVTWKNTQGSFLFHHFRLSEWSVLFQMHKKKGVLRVCISSWWLAWFFWKTGVGVLCGMVANPFRCACSDWLQHVCFDILFWFTYFWCGKQCCLRTFFAGFVKRWKTFSASSITRALVLLLLFMNVSLLY